MTEELDFPAPEPGDPEDVAWQLQTAGTMWSRGDSHEAIRWLRRAAEAAGDNGADMRAVALARAAADLTTALDIPPSIPPPAPAAAEQHTQIRRPWQPRPRKRLRRLRRQRRPRARLPQPGRRRAPALA